MCVRIVMLYVTVLLPTLMGSKSLQAQQPTLAQPNQGTFEKGLNTDGPVGLSRMEARLVVIEEKLERIAGDLELDFGQQAESPVLAGSGIRKPERPSTAEWVALLHAKSQEIDRQLESIEKKLSNSGSGPKPRAEGKFVIVNHTGVSQYISVNNAQFYVAPGRTEMWFPCKSVEAYLPGFEPRKLVDVSKWRWTGRQYEMRLDIRI